MAVNLIFKISFLEGTDCDWNPVLSVQENEFTLIELFSN